VPTKTIRTDGHRTICADRLFGAGEVGIHIADEGRQRACLAVDFDELPPGPTDAGVQATSVVNSTDWAIIPGHFAPRYWCVTC
jgi:hypothetical protein